MGYVVKCLSCGQQKIIELESEEALAAATCPLCSGPGDKLEIINSVQALLPDPELFKKMMAVVK